MTYVNCPYCGHKLLEGLCGSCVQTKCVKCGQICFVKIDSDSVSVALLKTNDRLKQNNWISIELRKVPKARTGKTANGVLLIQYSFVVFSFADNCLSFNLRGGIYEKFIIFGIPLIFMNYWLVKSQSI